MNKKNDFRVGETTIAKNGMFMEIVAYRSAKEIDVKFEDGYIAKNKSYQSFKMGTIKHPFPYQMDNILLEKKAFVYNSIGYFFCSCSKCGHRDIWTINKAKNHKCER